MRSRLYPSHKYYLPIIASSNLIQLFIKMKNFGVVRRYWGVIVAINYYPHKIYSTTFFSVTN